MLAILLERAKIQFSLLERSATPRLLGSAMALGPGVLPLFSQLGLLQEIQEHSRPVTRGMVWSEKLVPIMDLDHTTTGKRYGYLTRVIARPKLYQILMTQVPSERVFMGKKVTAFSQHSEASVLNKPGFQPGVTVICEDGDEFRGDLLVGADGAYSAIRQLLYQQIELKYGVQSDRETMAAGLGTEDLLKSETNTTGPTLPTPPPTLNGQSEGASPWHRPWQQSTADLSHFWRRTRNNCPSLQHVLLDRHCPDSTKRRFVLFKEQKSAKWGA
ncbi:hypothetical protein BGW38_005779 [Lunasporangiospora selenospora]|uniref:FAD-binding domain-containing protein n=1 Tax=Lunasporangiospora selenospora TaxID=979761 RepID=A0A9P6FPG9_9FUNG|nr:hypothetical protein BGW38_005779 [Lunasporangiospora selenospora]